MGYLNQALLRQNITLLKLCTAFLALVLLAGGGIVQPQDISSTPVLDLVIALDVSGSMNRDANENYFQEVDRGLWLLRDVVSGGEFRATDPAGQRFDLTENLLEWLATYSKIHTIDINASVMTFADGPDVLLEWTPLQRSNDQRLLPRLDRSATTSDTQQNSNFAALYDEIDELFSERSSESQRAVLLITDSVPCFPGGIRTASNPLYSTTCDDLMSMENHVNTLANLGRVNEYVLFVNNISTVGRWEPFGDLKNAWTTRIGDNGAFIDLDTLDALPISAMNAVLREVALASGTTTAEETPADTVQTELPDAVYASLGIDYSENGRLYIAPYQSTIYLLAALPTPDDSLTIAPDAETDTLYESGETALPIGRIRRPEAGALDVRVGSTGVPAWAMFTPAHAELTLLPQNPTRFTPQQLVYRLLDENGTAFEVTEDTEPSFQIQVRPPGNNSEPAIDLSAMTIGEDGQSFISPTFLPVTAGTYDLNVNVMPGNSSLWDLTRDPSYLMPENQMSVQVRGVTFRADFEFVAPESSAIRGEITTTAVTMPRSVPLRVTVRATSEDNRNVSLPEGMSATVNVTGDQSCPPGQAMAIDQESREVASAVLNFGEAGNCRVEVVLTITSTLPPLSETSREVALNTPRREVTITATERLSLRLVGDNGLATDGEAAEPHYHIIDRDSMPLLQGTPRTVVLRLEIVNDEGEPTEPVFAVNAPDNIDRQHCQAQTSPFITEGTPESTADADTQVVVPELDTGQIVPVQLQITLNEQDVARGQGICFFGTDTPGVYLAYVTGLPAGDYVVRASISRDEPPLDLNRFEYAPDLFSSTDTTAEVTARLRVDANPVIALQIGGTIAALAAVALVAFVTVTRYSAARIAPLRIEPAIYRIPRAYSGEPDKLLEPLWEGTLPGTFKHKFEATEFLRDTSLSLLNIEKLTFTTNRKQKLSRERAAKADILVNGGNPLKGEVLAYNSAREIGEDHEATYYLVNGLKPVTVLKLLEAAGKR